MLKGLVKENRKQENMFILCYFLVQMTFQHLLCPLPFTFIIG